MTKKKKILIKNMDVDMNMVVAEVAKQINGTPKKQGWLAKLFDKTNDKVSLSSVFIGVLLFVGVLLLLVPLFALIIEAWYNHTIATDLTGMAAYIGAVSAIFTVAAGLKGLVSHNDTKAKIAEITSGSSDECEEIEVIEQN